MLLGCGKLGISKDGCIVVLEEDGTNVDNDETLQQLDDSALMILQPGEEWSSVSGHDNQAAEQTMPVEDIGNIFLTLT